MRRITIFVTLALMLAACSDSEEQLKQRAAELCKYIPDHELKEESREYMTEEFYNVLDTLFNHLPEHEAMDHEWLYYFVTGNGGTIADYEVVSVEKTDANHAVATINVRQIWEDGSFDETSNVEQHHMSMEKVEGKWLIADFDGHKADCERHILINRQEQAVRQAISKYLVEEIGSNYLTGEICIPTLMMVREEGDSVWGDFWIEWYNASGDTLKTVSGGNHSGLMILSKNDNSYKVTSFEQTVDGAGNDASARRIFGEYYDIYQNMHSNEEVRDAVRHEQLHEYVQDHALPFRFYQDYGRDAIAL